eukprot:TRINITY_DN44783_c0_g1_i1.p1 TRINITY_DN44783_c0_g1~~TRINITY_DN44783_c0_g1_i1.p1  ORF type:complete len:1098 (+),score=327.22 TRINITY_DN44783_c0_g1_i1:96-3389(+)
MSLLRNMASSLAKGLGLSSNAPGAAQSAAGQVAAGGSAGSGQDADAEEDDDDDMCFFEDTAGEQGEDGAVAADAGDEDDFGDLVASMEESASVQPGLVDAPDADASAPETVEIEDDDLGFAEDVGHAPAGDPGPTTVAELPEAEEDAYAVVEEAPEAAEATEDAAADDCDLLMEEFVDDGNVAPTPGAKAATPPKAAPPAQRAAAAAAAASAPGAADTSLGDFADIMAQLEEESQSGRAELDALYEAEDAAHAGGEEVAVSSAGVDDSSAGEALLEEFAGAFGEDSLAEEASGASAMEVDQSGSLEAVSEGGDQVAGDNGQSEPEENLALIRRPSSDLGAVAKSAPSKPPGSSGNSSEQEQTAYVFVCNDRTQQQVEQMKLFGSPHREFDQMQKHISELTCLFLSNFQSMTLMGPFIVAEGPKRNLNPRAFGGKFSAQVAVAPGLPKLLQGKLPQRMHGGPKFGEEVNKIWTLLNEGGDAPPSVQKAWGITDDEPQPPPAKKPRLDDQAEESAAPEPSNGDLIEIDSDDDAPAEGTAPEEDAAMGEDGGYGEDSGLGGSDEAADASAGEGESGLALFTGLGDGTGLDDGSGLGDTAGFESPFGEFSDAGDAFSDSAWDASDLGSEMGTTTFGQSAPSSGAPTPKARAQGRPVTPRIPAPKRAASALSAGSSPYPTPPSSPAAGFAQQPMVSNRKGPGFVFLCTKSTQPEIERHALFGSPERDLAKMRQNIKANDTRLFLLNYESRTLMGPFVAKIPPNKNIVPQAFHRRFAAQVRVMPLEEPLKQVDFKSKLQSVITANQVAELMTQLAAGREADAKTQMAWNMHANGGSSSPSGKGGPRGAMNMKNAKGNHNHGQPQPLIQANLSGGGKAKGVGKGNGKKGKATNLPQAALDKEGRPYDLSTVVVNFCNVGASYATTVLGKTHANGDRLFDWHGVRQCVKFLIEELEMQVVGVIFENYWGPDCGQAETGLPHDIKEMCTAIMQTPRVTGRNHKSADDEMTIKAAYRRNCRFMDNDNYRDWLQELRDTKTRVWLENCQDLLQMRYYFDPQLGTFDTLDGNIPVGLLASNAAKTGHPASPGAWHHGKGGKSPWPPHSP